MNADTTLPGQGRHIAEGERRGGICGRIAGAVLVALGSLILLHQFGLMTAAEFRYVIPAGFVALGAFLLLRRP